MSYRILRKRKDSLYHQHFQVNAKKKLTHIRDQTTNNLTFLQVWTVHQLLRLIGVPTAHQPDSLSPVHTGEEREMQPSLDIGCVWIVLAHSEKKNFKCMKY